MPEELIRPNESVSSAVVSISGGKTMVGSHCHTAPVRLSGGGEEGHDVGVQTPLLLNLTWQS